MALKKQLPIRAKDWIGSYQGVRKSRDPAITELEFSGDLQQMSQLPRSGAKLVRFYLLQYYALDAHACTVRKLLRLH